MDFKVFKNKLLIFGMAITSMIYIIWRIFFTIPIGFGLLSVVCGIILLVVEIGGIVESAIHVSNMSNITYPERPIVNDEKLYPHVDVFIATYNEPVDLLFKTINGCLNMDYPDKSKVHIYICDDGNRTEMQDLAHKMGVNYITRTEHKHAKAGNLNNALNQTNSPLVVTFDADMIPMHDFLMACVPYFIKDLVNAEKIEEEQGLSERKKRKGKIGFVQTPQSFYNPDLFQYNLFSENRIPNEQDYFYRHIQVSRNRNNTVIYGGSNTVISREALYDIGGFYTKVITEDFATGMLIQTKGYKCIAVDEVHASGLSPQDLKSLIKQRERWGRGCIQTGRKLNILFRKGLNFSQKLSYMSAIIYWYSALKRFVYIIFPIIYAIFGVVVIKCTILQMLIFWLPSYILSSLVVEKLSGNIRDIKWTNVYETILFPSLLGTVLLETVGISKNKFAVTKKEGASYDKNYNIKKAIPHMVLWVLSLIGILSILGKTFIERTPGYGVLLFWLLINFYNITIAIFFMLGREVNRKTERVYAKVQCEITYDNEVINCITNDISEGGAGIILDYPAYIPYDKEICIKLKTERYECKFTGQISNIQEYGDKWKYGIMLKQIDEEGYKNLLNILYDREPAFPKKISKSNNILEDIRINITKRNKKEVFNRKLPRIELYKELSIRGAEDIEIINLNFEYALINLDNDTSVMDRISIPLGENVVLNCKLDENKNKEQIYVKDEDRYAKSHKILKRSMPKNKKNTHLYIIENYEKLVKNSEFKSILSQWIIEYRNNSLSVEKTKHI